VQSRLGRQLVDDRLVRLDRGERTPDPSSRKRAL
jgi:hypothetical protein